MKNVSNFLDYPVDRPQTAHSDSRWSHLFIFICFYLGSGTTVQCEPPFTAL